MKRWGRIGAAVAVLLALSGCEGGMANLLGREPLYIYVEKAGGSIGNPAESDGTARQSQALIDGFRKLNPNVDIHVNHFAADQIVEAMAFRQSRGLGPDLVVSPVVTALRLHERGLTEAVALNPVQLDRLAPRFRNDFRLGSRYMAIPLLAKPQAACFDRRRVSDPPTTLTELLELSAKGLQVGLPLQFAELLWTASSFDADDTLLQLVEHPPSKPSSTPVPISADDRRQLQAWLTWLAATNLQTNVSFAEDDAELVGQLERGERDWISCNGNWLDPLSRKLGHNLGMSVLPGAEGRPAKPITALRVWSFGRHSTGRQRKLAEAFVLFSLNKVNQREMMLSAPGTLPVNPDVLVPTKSSHRLAALATSLENSHMLNFSNPEQTVAAARAIDFVLQRTVQGELTPAEATAMLLSNRPAAALAP
jgi:arabinogalactan oligomer / maltooligosaccharide transport system substrate-binding protein